MSSDLEKQIQNGGENNERNFSNFVVITVSADGLAPLGARTSAGTVVTKFKSWICSRPKFYYFYGFIVYFMIFFIILLL